ncbi:MAG: hypothetical protein IJZ57_04435 [Clostridia bacterium]|nr:hypothetical protein [Clostridia bacterium]
MKHKTRKVYILLTRLHDFGSRAAGFFASCYYTHSSIGLEEDMNIFYSFMVNGFVEEDVSRFLRSKFKPFPCQLYEIEVSEEVYDKIKAIINEFKVNKKLYRYTKLGVLSGLFWIPRQRKYEFFCSHFVAHVLKKSNAVKLKKNTALYFPRDFKKHSGLSLSFQGNLRGFANKFLTKPETV